MLTPSQLGIKKNTVVAPEGGWKSETYYIAEVAFSTTNVIHKVIFYSGFLTDGVPCGYNCLLSPTLDEKHCLHDTYYLKALEELDINLKREVPVNKVGFVKTESKWVSYNDTNNLVETTEANEIDSIEMNHAAKRALEETPVVMTDVEIKEQELKANELHAEVSACLDFEPWHINWITRSSGGVIKAWEPDNTCIYEGTALNDACLALSSSDFGG